VKRTQLYLEDDVWTALHVRSRQSGLSISELVRQAVRGRYMNPGARRREAMRALAGLWNDRPDAGDAEAYVRRLRQGRRLERLAR
jgi:hypothetical protein